MNNAVWIPVLVALLSGGFALYAALQARGTEVTKRYYGDIYDRVVRLESENQALRDRYYSLREENINLKERLARLEGS